MSFYNRVSNFDVTPMDNLNGEVNTNYKELLGIVRCKMCNNITQIYRSSTGIKLFAPHKTITVNGEECVSSNSVYLGNV